MDERAQTYQLDPKSPTYELLRRILRLTAFPWLVVVLVLFVTGAVTIFPALMLTSVAVIDYAVIPAALRRFPGQVTISPDGLTTSARRGTLTIPWGDIDLIEVRGGGDQSFRWLYEVLRVDPVRDFVFIGVRTNSETRRKAQYLKSLSLYVEEPRRFVDAANELRFAAL